MFRFTIRDLLWLMVVVALGLGWFKHFMDSERNFGREYRASLRLNWLMMSMYESGYVVSFDDRANSVTISPPLPPPNPSAPAPNPPSE